MNALNSFFNLKYIIILCFLHFSTSQARFSNVILNAGGEVSRTITVDINGGGDFTSVQKAIDSVPQNNQVWTHIHVKPGTYTEQIRTTIEKPFIALSGESRETTVIQWAETGRGMESAAAVISGDNFVAANINFKNTYNLGDSKNSVQVAPAVTVYADKASFYNVGFYGVQDTLTDQGGRHYFNSCYIQGAVDFIWGGGQSIYQDCIINATAGGAITAQARESDGDKSGFVFLNGHILGQGPSYLGRAYRSHSRVVFKGTDMDNIIEPQGWNIWEQAGHEDTIVYAEADCRGPGANNSNRVKWEKVLSAEELGLLTNINTFINQEGWIEAQPKIQ